MGWPTQEEANWAISSSYTQIDKYEKRYKYNYKCKCKYPETKGMGRPTQEKAYLTISSFYSNRIEIEIPIRLQSQLQILSHTKKEMLKIMKKRLYGFGRS